MRVLVAVAVALALAGATAPASARTWQQQWKVGPHPSVHVETNDASVFVHQGPAGSVTAVIEHTVQVWGMRSVAHDPQISFRRAGDAVTISARTHSIVVVGMIQQRFRIDVTVPLQCDIEVRGTDGSIEAGPSRGRLDLQTHDGSIRVQDARGQIRLWTGDGGIDADGLDGALDAHSGDGHVRVRGRFDEVDLHAGDGPVEVAALHGSVLAKPWWVISRDGGITLRVPRDLRAMLDASTRDGQIMIDLPVALHGDDDRHHVSVALNRGTVPLRVHAGDGSIRVEHSD